MKIANDLRFLLKVSRPGFWSTSMWFYLLPVGHVHRLDHAGFWIGLFYVGFPLGSFIYGWNDYADRETDRLNPRKGNYLFGSRGDDDQLDRLPTRLVLIQLVCGVLFYGFVGPKILIWFLALAIATGIYNAPRFGFKNLPGLDLINQAGYLLVFVLSSWLNDVPQLPWQTFVFGALFAMHSHLLGQIMDIEPDRAAGRRTTAVCVGLWTAKFLLAALLLGETLFVHHYFHDRMVTGFLGVSTAWFMIDTVVLVRDRPYTAFQMRLFLILWNVVALGSMVWVWYRAPLISLH